MEKWREQSVNYASRFASNRGLSLISTLWILTILSLLATQFLHSIRLEQRAQANFADRTKFYYTAKAGFERTIAMLRADETPYDSFNEEWTQGLEEQIEDGLRSGNSLTYQVQITDEGSKININTADADVIRGLLSMVGYEEEEATEQPIAEAIVQGRPYRTVRDLARVEGMTQEILYGQQQADTTGTASTLSAEGEDDQQNTPGLIDLATVYSIDKNTDANGQQRVNIKSADSQQLTQLQANNNQSIFTQGEAESLTQQQDSINSIGDLLDVQAVSDQIFDNIRDRISVDSSEDNQDMVNINTADESQLQTLDGIDQGIAQRIIAHRDNQENFQDVDQLKDVKLVTTDEFKNIVDKITTTDDETISGLININTASQEILQLLSGMDEQKAQAIIDRRETTPENNQQNQGESEEEGNPFTNIGQLLDVQGIDVDTFRQISNLVTYRSHGFLIKATGVDSRGKAIATCIGAVDRTGEQIAIRYWKQN